MQADTQANPDGMKTFEQIPSVPGLPIVGTLLWYMPYIGKYQPFKLHHTNESKLRKYGPIVKDTILGRTYLLVFDPADITRVFKFESKHPHRETLLSLKEYRVRKHSNTCDPNAGLIVTQGQSWLKCRTELNPALLKTAFVSPHVATMNAVALEAVRLLSTHSDDEDVHKTMYLWALENSTQILLGKKLGALMPEPSRECQEIITAIRGAGHIVGSLEFPFPPIWRWIATHSWNIFERNEDLFKKFIEDCVEERFSKAETSSESCDLLTYIINGGRMNSAELITSLTDLVFAAVDTTAFTASFALHYLALNPHVQEAARQEIMDVDELDLSRCESLPYLRSVIKETLRLKPVVPGVFRVTARDLVLSGFHVPAGTKIFTQNHVACLEEKHFAHAKEFMPERWFDTSFPEYAFLPFGSGARACIGRRVAETMLVVFLTRVLQRFVLSSDDKEIDILTGVVSSPEAPIRIKFRDLPQKQSSATNVETQSGEHIKQE